MKIFILLWCLGFSALWAMTPFPSLVKKGKHVLQASESPYLLEGSAVLSVNDTLIVEPGVEVQMNGYARLLLRGKVSVLGTAEKPVVFHSADSSESWNGFHLITGSRTFLIRNLIVKNAFRNTVTESAGTFENVKFESNYYGLWVQNSPKLNLSKCSFTHNRFGLSVESGVVSGRELAIEKNTFGLYIEQGAAFRGDRALIRNNLEKDERSEAEELAVKHKKVPQKVWRRLEEGF
ncbi:MAG: right-handed parallel beta-helix repeat-containing protein [Fibrobacter sp.]|jgi:hypothetical protein|nr:right-handed parallel beta-helix repeat-containing protein [Fibrobacter sp.]